jgi:hypothetical protein
MRSSDQCAEDHGRRARVIECGMRRSHVETEHLDEPREAGGLALRQLEHEPGQRGGVDDRVGERAFQAPAYEPRVERVMAVLDEHGALRET